MLKILLFILLFLHGAVHLMGFAKSVNPSSVIQLKQNITSAQGILWLITAIVYIAAGIMVLLQKDQWWIPGGLALLVSQILIIQTWSDARYGTIANVLVLLAVLIGLAQWRFRSEFRVDVKTLVHNHGTGSILHEQDLVSLPEPVRKYIRYTGYVGKSKTSSFKASFEGRIRGSENADWMKFRADQYSNIVMPARYFFIRANMKGIPVDGYHRFSNGIAVMDIRVLSLFKVQNADGLEMNISETVTHFNDMCLLAPGSLIDNRITWETVNDHEVKSTFTNKGITISAVLQFNEKGELVNFISDNRYMMAAKNKAVQTRWMTPVKNYKESGGIRFPASGDAIWVLPGGNFTYASLNFNSVTINPDH